VTFVPNLSRGVESGVERAILVGMSNTHNTTDNNYPTRIETVTYERDGEIKSYDFKIVTFPVTIDGETREIEFSGDVDDKRLTSGWHEFGCRRGQGTKIHATKADIVLHNGEWVFNWRSGYALNRGDCLIVAFPDTVSDARKSEHVGTAIAKEVG
jgi:hypothetical protein